MLVVGVVDGREPGVQLSPLGHVRHSNAVHQQVAAQLVDNAFQRPDMTENTTTTTTRQNNHSMIWHKTKQCGNHGLTDYAIIETSSLKHR